MILRSPLCLLLFFIIQCQPCQKQPENSHARGSTRAADAQAQGAERLPDCSADAHCQAYQDFEDDETVAVPPTSVAGAFLTCLKAADPAFLACQVQNGKTQIRVPPAASLDWSIALESTAIPTTAKVHDGLSAGTFFFVSRPVGAITSVSLNVKEGEASDTLSFALSGLPSEESSIQLMAMPTEVIPPSSIESTASFEVEETLGNGVLSDESDGCLGQVDSTAATQTVTKDINYADDAGKVSLYADKVCGLQGSKVYMSLIPPPPAKRLQVKLVPNARRLLMFKDIDFVPGPMSFTFGYLSGESQDDVRLGSFTFVH